MLHRLLALLASTLVGLGLGLLLLRWARPEPELLSFHEADVEALARDREEALASDREPGSSAFPYRLSEAEAERLFGLEAYKRTYDPLVGFRMEPERVLEKTWEEYPGGAYVSRTSSEGLADRELDRAAHFDLRVLAAGDSHTFGLCEVEETWCSELERGLAGSFPGRSFEVLNTGQSSYTFYQYLGMLEAYLDWDPEVFVMAVFAGNDFAELLGLAPIFGEGEPRTLPPRRRELQREALAERDYKPAMGQCYNTILKFTTRPEWIAPALECSLGVVRRIQEICDRRGMLFVTVVIPLPCCLSWEPEPEAFETLERGLRIRGDGCAVANELIDGFLAGLDELGVQRVDLRPAMAELDEPPFWERDLHLDLAGHELVAREVRPLLEAWLGAERGW